MFISLLLDYSCDDMCFDKLGKARSKYEGWNKGKESIQNDF